MKLSEKSHPFEHHQVPGGAPELWMTSQAVPRLAEPPPILESHERLAALAGTSGRLSATGAMSVGPKARPVAAEAPLALVPEALDQLRELLRQRRHTLYVHRALSTPATNVPTLTVVAVK